MLYVLFGYCVYDTYRVTLVVADHAWLDFDLDVPSSCLATQPVLPISQLPLQNFADNGTSKFESTQPRSASTSVILYSAVQIKVVKVE